jgi:hypothetical protein
MVPVAALWLPIVLSAVLVFVVSAVIHMGLRYHKKDFVGLPDEEAARAVLGKQDLPPGQYMMPHCDSMKEAAGPEMTKKFTDGPVAIITVLPRGPMNIGKNLLQWFLLSLGVSIVVAYVLRPLPADAEYLLRFRVAAAAAWAAYGGGLVWAGIWKGTPWSKVWIDVFDSFVYALVTAGAFAGLWPK